MVNVKLDPHAVAQVLLDEETRDVINESLVEVCCEEVVGLEFGGVETSIEEVAFGDLLREHIDELVVDVVMQIAEDHVAHNQAEATFRYLMEVVTPRMIMDMLIESLEELELEDIMEEICDEVVVEFVRESTVAALSDFEDAMKAAQIEEVAHITQSKLVEGLLTQQLLDSVATHAQRLVLSQYCNRMVAKVIIDSCIANSFTIHESRQTTKENQVLDVLHKDCIAEVGSEVVREVLVEQIEALMNLHEVEGNEYAFF